MSRELENFLLVFIIVFLFMAMFVFGITCCFLPLILMIMINIIWGLLYFISIPLLVASLFFFKTLLE